MTKIVYRINKCCEKDPQTIIKDSTWNPGKGDINLSIKCNVCLIERNANITSPDFYNYEQTNKTLINVWNNKDKK